jgi:hypothetical protein
LIHAGFRGGFHVALVPADLRPGQVEVAFREPGSGAEEMLDVGDWRTTSDNVAVAHVPFPEEN